MPNESGFGSDPTTWMHTATSVFLISTTPLVALLVPYIQFQKGGSVCALWDEVVENGPLTTLSNAWVNPSETGLMYLAVFVVWQLAIMRLVPGKEFRARSTATGHVPVYTDNGVACFLLTMTAYYYTTRNGWFAPADVLAEFPGIMCFMTVFALFVVLGLYFKGIYAPSTKDNSSTGNFVFDYYWGTELYPRVFGWDVKQFTNCRFGMMAWAVICCLAYDANGALHGGEASNDMKISVGLQLIYIFKFFYWETGYFNSMDIQHDRAGYMICWGCLIWVPLVYASQAVWHVNREPVFTSSISTALFFAFGVLCIWLNYDCDDQRVYFRATNGAKPIWGKIPTKIVAHWKDTNGKTHKSLLLTSGWWGMARHIHYVFEIASAICWSVPGHCAILPYFYVGFLTILLTHRAIRDDDRCGEKYGKYWDRYKEAVPYHVVPYVW